MRRVLSLRNTLAAAMVLVGFLFLTSSFTFGPVEDAALVGSTPQKNEKRVKVIVNVDDKVTKIDTIFNLPDQKVIDEKIDSMLTKLGVEGRGCYKSKKIKCSVDRKMRDFHGKMDNNPDEEQFDIMIQNDDSGKRGEMRKIIRLRVSDNEIINEEGDEDELLPPPPPMPPHAGMFHQRFGGDPFAMDARDESIISYEKKDMGDGLEKITIVRKKHDDHHMAKEIRVKVGTSDDSLIKKKEDERKASKKLRDEAEATKGEKK